jgi:hypothetical protein
MLSDTACPDSSGKFRYAGKKLQTLFFFLLISTTAVSQDITYRKILPDKLANEKLKENQKSNVDVSLEINCKETLLLISEGIYWQTALRNQQREFYQEERFDAKDTRTTINKALLGNGFLLIERIWQHWDVSVWVNYSKSLYTYDENNNETEALHQNWDVSVWVNFTKYSYTYDVNNNRIELLTQSWYHDDWLNGYKYSYTYDGNNNQSESLYQEWNGSASAWVNYSKNLYTYDENNNQTEELSQTWDGYAWVNDNRYSYTYDVNNNQIESLHQRWNGSASAWVNVDRYSYTYNSDNNLIESLNQTWVVSAWVNKSKYSYTYDGNNNLIESLNQTWYVSAWANSTKYSYTYNVNNNQTESLYQIWIGSTWVNASKYSYTYVPVTAVNEHLSSVNFYSLSNNYPNPFNPSTKINYAIPERGNVSLKVFDLLGNELAELVKGEIDAGTYDITFNAANLPSGVYFYRLQVGDFLQTRKMILLK